jgi:peroxiredoxin
MNPHETTHELDPARAKYRGQIIPKTALAIMDAETARVTASNLASDALKTGDSAPHFILPAAHGEPLRLYSLLRDGPVVVVFYRGGWCPYCNLHLRGFQGRLTQFRERGVQIVAISPRLPDNSLSTQEKNELAFPVLSAAGVRWFLKADLALSVEARSLQLSCAGMDSPNLGLANVNGMLGISWFF